MGHPQGLFQLHAQGHGRVRHRAVGAADRPQGEGLLDTTIVWTSGEFGRTPKIDWEEPWNGGRHHYSKCFSALVAGGGFKGGCAVGVSDETASEVRERPVTPADFLGSICECAGIDPDAPLPNPKGLDVKVMPTNSRYGRLKELYRE